MRRFSEGNKERFPDIGNVISEIGGEWVFKTIILSMEDYADEQTASLQKQVEELREENERLKKQQGIVAKDFFYWWFNTPGTNTEQGYESYLKTDRYKALNPQDNQK